MAVQFKPGQTITWRPNQGFWLDGEPFVATGTNYVASYICTNYWEDWRPEELKKDLDLIAKLGLNALRIPIHWEYAEPAPGQFRPEMMERLGQFLTWAEERGLAVMPWFLIGVATQFYDVSWRKGGNFFEEPMVGHAVNHIQTFVARFKDRPNILCWDLCDEPEFYAQMPGGEQLPYEPVRFKNWVTRLYEGVKQVDPVHAVMMGFGHLITNHYGMHVREMEQITDMMGVTGYTHDGDMELLHSFRNTYFLPWYLRMNDTQGRGVFASEAPGWSTVNASEFCVGLHFRLVLHSMLAAGSWGFLPWVWNDFVPEIWDKPPLDVAVFEPGFGLCRVDGTYKDSGKEFGVFAEHARKYPLQEWALEGPEACILIPSGYYTNNIELHFRTMFVAFMAARMAGLRVRFVWEADWTAEADCKLLILPGAPSGLTISSWQKVEKWVAKGGTLYCSQGFQRLIYPRINQLCGIDLQGAGTATNGLTWEATFNSPAKLASQGTLAPAKCRMVVNPADAEVWATTPDGEPILFHNKFGEGQVILLTHSAEQSMATMESAEFETHPLHTIYRAAAELAGLKPLLQASDPRLEVSIQAKGSQKLVTIINHSSAALGAEIECAKPVVIEEVLRGSGVPVGQAPTSAFMIQAAPSEVVIFLMRCGE